jgi:hypothetical protein
LGAVVATMVQGIDAYVHLPGFLIVAARTWVSRAR